MRAVVYQKYGGIEQLKLKEVQKPIPKEKEVLIKLQAASVNSWDWDLLRGSPLVNRIGGWFTPKFPILGCDIAGIIEAVGSKVTIFNPGDAVFGDTSHTVWGGYAEYVCAPEDNLTIKPPTMTFEEAAAIPQAGVLALQGLRMKGDILPGQKILFNGAGGGVGTIGLQIAKSFGAEVTCVDKAEKLDLLQSLGADHVIDYRQEDFTKTGKQYDLILDVVANKSVFVYKNCLVPNGLFSIVGGASSTIINTILFGPLLSRFTGKHIRLLMHQPSQADQKILADYFLEGKFKPVVSRIFPLEEVPGAIRLIAAGEALGKLVIKIN